MNLKIAVAQISTDPGSIQDNTEKIIQYIKKAKSEDADILVFPELTIPGYMSLDLMLQNDYIKQNLKALKKIIGVPSETLRDIRTGHIKSPGIATLQKIAAHYQLPQRACQKNRNVKEAHV